MKRTNDIRVEMYKVVDDLAVFVKVNYLDKEAQEHAGLMMLDSGSSYNTLSGTMGDCIGELCKLDDKTEKILTITGEKVTANFVHFSFAMGGMHFHEKFCIYDNKFPRIEGEVPVIGILGVAFMRHYNLAIDYSDFTFRTSHASPKNLSNSDCDFFFPMEFGIKYYGVPALGMKQGEKEIIALADTGATDNMISAPILSDERIDCEFLESKSIIYGLTGGIETKDIILGFGLLTWKDDKEGFIQRKDSFKVHPQYIIEPPKDLCDEDGNQVPPVGALLCSSFMAKEGWVLDFGARIIYKKTQVTVS